MLPLRARVIQAHIARLQSKLARRASLPKPPVQLELDPGEIEYFRHVTAAEDKRSAAPSVS
jgi:hypothetical protein